MNWTADRAGVRVLEGGTSLYHLKRSRRSLPRGATAVRPRHLLAFRIVDGGIVVLRVLHDAMDLPSRLADI